MNKSILRKNLLIKRSKVKNRSQNEFKIFQRLETIINNNSLIVAGYLSVRSEVNLNLFLSFLLKNKFSLCLPYIENLKSPLIFKKFSMNTKLVRGKYNIMHPNNEIILIPNIILIPLVGFDESKNRIGYGGGYYDRLRKNKGWRSIPSFVIISQNCISERVLPRESWDIPFDGWINENRLHQIKQAK